MNPIYEVENSLVSIKHGEYSKEIPEQKYDELNGFIYVFKKCRKVLMSILNRLSVKKSL
jgi:signal transduction histidine kinase